jgi:hypothetical protein
MAVLSTLRDSNTDQQVHLTKADDWADWEHELLLNIRDLDLTEHIVDKKPLIKKPKMPEIAQKKYTKKRQTLKEVPSGQQQQSESNTPLEEDEDALDVRKNDDEFNVSDLTKEGKEIYDADLAQYDR